MGTALYIFTAFLFISPAPLIASALGQLESQDWAGQKASSIAVPVPNGVPVGSESDRSSEGGSWMLHCDCSSCPRAWYPDPHPTKGPYATESACQQDLNEAKYRPGAASCESYYCQQTGGASSGGAGGGAGAAAVKSGVGEAVKAAAAAVARNNNDRGIDLLAPGPASAGTGDGDGARYGIGRRKRPGARKPKPTPEPEAFGGKVKLLREKEDLGSPYIDCKGWKAAAARFRSGLGVQKDAIARTEAMLGSAEQGAIDAQAKGEAQAKDFAANSVKSLASDMAGRMHLMEKGLSKALTKGGMGRAGRVKTQKLMAQATEVKEKAESMAEAGTNTGKFMAAGGAEAWMRGPLQGLQASWTEAMADAELRDELLNYAGETVSDFGGPAMAWGYKLAKLDIDLTALAVSKGLDEKEAAVHRKHLQVMKGELAKNLDRIRFLEEEGSKQCP